MARKNVERFFGTEHPAWELAVGDLQDNITEADTGSADRVVLDMLAPWECADVVAQALVPGGVVCCYVATATQLSRTVETFRAHGSFTEPASWESMVRTWHVEGLAVRPDHRMIGHTGFLVTSRRLADGRRATAAPTSARQGRRRRGRRCHDGGGFGADQDAAQPALTPRPEGRDWSPRLRPGHDLVTVPDTSPGRSRRGVALKPDADRVEVGIGRGVARMGEPGGEHRAGN